MGKRGPGKATTLLCIWAAVSEDYSVCQAAHGLKTPENPKCGGGEGQASSAGLAPSPHGSCVEADCSETRLPPTPTHR